MANCRGVMGRKDSSRTQELCRYCRSVRDRTRFLFHHQATLTLTSACLELMQQACEECYVTTSDRNSMLQAELSTRVRHQHVCLGCALRHPEAASRRHHGSGSLSRVNSAPSPGHWPRVDTLPHMARDHNGRPHRTKPRSQRSIDLDLPTVDLRQRQTPDNIEATTHRGHSGRSRKDATSMGSANLELSTVDLRPRRNTCTTNDAPTSSSCDFSSRPRPVEAPTSMSCDFTGSASGLDLPDDLLSSEVNELELSTVDLRLPKYKPVSSPQTKRGRRKATVHESTKSALTPISIRDIASIESVDLGARRHQPEDTKSSKAEQYWKMKAETNATSDTEGVPTPKRIDTIDSKLALMHLRSERLQKGNATPEKARKPNSSETGGVAIARKHIEPIDFHLSTVDLRPRRHTTDSLPDSPPKDGRRPRNPETAAKDEPESELISVERRRDIAPIDFHLSTFNLRPRRHTTDTMSESPKAERDHEQQHRSNQEPPLPLVSSPEQEAPRYSKDDPCDLSYLTNFRSYTL
ncbi:hypothetical protein BBJ28_00002225 [Nothophytophthora sp. Chile5]|nr:hypothetical protein BBJ28_00002225 [Nothophytophthora sp. Chile5]